MATLRTLARLPMPRGSAARSRRSKPRSSTLISGSSTRVASGDPVLQPGLMAAGPLRNLYSLTREELGTLLAGLGQPRYRGAQVWEWLYANGARGLDDMRNVPAAARAALGSCATLGSLSVAREQTSKDGTIKRLYRLADGNAIESVLMTYDDGRRTVCASSQAGCAMRCSFCATGQRGFTRNLTSTEILEQVLYFHRELVHTGARVSNVVLMGMGEPLANLRHVIPALHRLSSDLSIGFRHITVSTVGLAPQIIKLADTGPPVRLAVSLHAATDEARAHDAHQHALPAGRAYGRMPHIYRAHTQPRVV
eukprot:m.44786 g.44786  ORF g.44786 m.44786 type:complete len:309 (+) comp5843_c0_seq1:498-1424(+)